MGSFANTPAQDLGSRVLEAVVERAGVEKNEVSETILGQVLTAGQGQNPARQAHINAGLARMLIDLRLPVALGVLYRQPAQSFEDAFYAHHPTRMERTKSVSEFIRGGRSWRVV